MNKITLDAFLAHVDIVCMVQIEIYNSETEGMAITPQAYFWKPNDKSTKFRLKYKDWAVHDIRANEFRSIIVTLYKE